MKNNKLIIIAIIASVVLVIGAVFVYFIANPQITSNEDDATNDSVFNENNNGETIQEETEILTNENLADDIESEEETDTIEQRSLNEIESGIVTEIQSAINQYINGRYAPMNEEEYNQAISMHSQEIIDNHDFSYQNQFENSYALNEEKNVDDVAVNVEMIDQQGVEGTYTFTLVVEMSNDTEEIEHEGDFTLSTYDNGYMYISQFGDTSE